MCRKCKEYNKFERKKSKSRQAIGRSNMWETGYCDEGFYGKGNFDSVDDYKWRKWSRIRKVKHRNKNTVNKEIK